MDNYDIVIVGAGPAGVTAALHSEGNVLLMEKNKEIGKPIRCGEGLFGKIADYFDVRDCLRDTHVAYDVEFVFPSGKSKKMTIKSNDIFVINKDIFLQRILAKAKERNPNLIVKTGAKAWYDAWGKQVYLDGNPVDSKVIIDASGMASQVGKSAGMSCAYPPKDVHVCAQYTIESPLVDPYLLRLFIDEPYSPTGYTWVFPKGNDKANVGMGVSGAQHYNIQHYLDWFLNDNYKECKKENYFVAPLGLTPPVEHCVHGNILLTGDAARFCISMSGAGIGNAMLSGMHAGKVASFYNKGQLPLSHYETLMDMFLYKKLRKAYKYKEYFLRKRNMKTLERAASFLFSMHKAFPRTVEKFALKNFRF